MSFNSFGFLLFIFPVFFVWILTPIKYKWAILLLASLVFYGWMNPVYLLLLFSSIGITYYGGLLLEREKRKVGFRHLVLYSTLFINIGVLIVFKYLGFFSDILIFVSQLFDSEMNLTPIRLLLPIGISFYTFQCIGYILDIYFGVQKAEKHLGYFALFVSFFPQILSGPIGRTKQLLPQISNPKPFILTDLSCGLQRFAWGLFKKMVIADRLDTYVNEIYSNVSNYPGSVLWLGTFLFAFQLYCDFSGYTDMAIGIARMFGVSLLENFNFPFVSQNVTEFWRRWHISLSNWLRDYLYTPIQFSKKKWKRGATVYAISLTFLICGLWHGAKLTFVMFGIFQSLALVYEMMTRELRKEWAERISPYIYKPISWLITFLFTLMSFVFFRAETTSDAFLVLQNQFGNIWNYSAVFDFIKIQGGAKFIFSMSLLLFFIITDKFYTVAIKKQSYKGVVMNLIAVSLIVMILIFGNFGEVEFIYFKF